MKYQALILASLLLSACSTTETPVETPTGETPDTKTEELVFQPFIFEVPANWTVEPGMNDYELHVPDSEYDVSFIFTLEKSDVLPTETDKVETTVDGVQIFTIGCGGAYHCGNLAYDGQGYEYVFELKSTEPAPENLDGVWTPKTDVSQEDLQNFIRTILIAE